MRLTRRATLLAAVILAAPALAFLQDGKPAEYSPQPPQDLFEVVKVVDGDTVHVMRDGKVEKLRLLSVDTEEKLSGRGGSATKPETVYGEECALWAKEVIDAVAKEGKPAHVGLAFPGGDERRDIYGRLLCHVILPDGTDFNLMLVQLGKSPYFNKYGNSKICHAAFEEAQAAAQKEKLGIWDPKTNEPKTPGAPAAKRPYDTLLPWWNARAEAIDDYREQLANGDSNVAEADLATSVEAAFKKGPEEVVVFGQIFKIYDEDDGSQTVAFRRGSKETEIKVRIAKEHVAAHAKLDLAGSLNEFRQNYLYVKGELKRGKTCFEMKSTSPEQWRLAGPEPKK